MRRVLGPAAAVCLGIALAPIATAEPAPVPEGWEPPVGRFTITQVWEAPRSTMERFYTDPAEQETADLEEALGATNDIVTLSDRFLFDFDSAELRPSAAASLDTLVEILNDTENPVSVIGHTDGMGSDAVNQPLSEDRAQAVADYLVDQGIAESRITTEGKGSSDPVADNTHADGRDNPEGRAENRRVEIRYGG